MTDLTPKEAVEHLDRLADIQFWLLPEEVERSKASQWMSCQHEFPQATYKLMGENFWTVFRRTFEVTVGSKVLQIMLSKKRCIELIRIQEQARATTKETSEEDERE